MPKFFGNSTLIYTHQLKLGITRIKTYGIALAMLSNIPSTVLERASKIARNLSITAQVIIEINENNLK